ncbi:AAA family ATPase [Chitinophaga sp. CC14]|uniref:AAA family ATPase n=1 Tax=Chitinophaga sp. CC14 TaxID=3029199 RepID=UPI003B80E926
MTETNISNSTKNEKNVGITSKIIHQVKETAYKDAYTARELFKMNIHEVPFLLDGLIPQTGLSCLTGSSDCNKSTFLRQLSLEIALGSENHLGFKLNTRHKKVIYISTEDDFAAISALIKKQYSKDRPEEILDNIYFVFSTESHIKRLGDILKSKKVDLVVLDTWTDLFSGDLNQSNKVRGSFEAYNELSRKYGCAFIFVHHQGKRTEDNSPSKNNLLGSQGIEAKMRAVVELRRDIGSRRLLTITKGNYSKDSFKGKSFVLELQEDTMLFQRKDETVNFSVGYGFEGLKVKFDKKAIIKKLLQLKSDGLSFEKAHKKITENFENAPGLTTLKTWFKDQSDSQTPSK